MLFTRAAKFLGETLKFESEVVKLALDLPGLISSELFLELLFRLVRSTGLVVFSRWFRRHVRPEGTDEVIGRASAECGRLGWQGKTESE